MAATARDVIAANRLDRTAGGPIEVVVGRIEDLQSLPVDKVGHPRGMLGHRGWLADLSRSGQRQQCGRAMQLAHAKAVQSAHQGQCG